MRDWAITNPTVGIYRRRQYSNGDYKNLARALACCCVVNNMRSTPDVRFVLNVGRTTVPRWFNPDTMDWINDPTRISNASDKLRCFMLLEDYAVPCLPWTIHPEVAEDWFRYPDTIVYARTSIRGTRGSGIIVCRTLDELPMAPLYTLGRPDREEYRVHVFEGQVIDVTKKKRLGSKKREERGMGEPDMDIRNLKNGWIFARQDINPSEQLKQACIDAVDACGLTFGGVDVFQYPDGSAEVCEINTSPAMMGTTINRYADAIRQYCA